MATKANPIAVARVAAEEKLVRTREAIVSIDVADQSLCGGAVSDYVHVKVPRELAVFLKSVRVACNENGSTRPVQRRGQKEVKSLADTVVYVLDRVHQAMR